MQRRPIGGDLPARLAQAAKGDKSVAGCARTVSETLALCESLRKLAARNSPRAIEVAKIAMVSCLDCEKE